MSWGARLGMAWRYITRMEPARVRSVVTALVLVASTLGVTVPTGLDDRVVGVVAALALLAPLLQGEATRRHVVPQARNVAQVAAARDAPPNVG